MSSIIKPAFLDPDRLPRAKRFLHDAVDRVSAAADALDEAGWMTDDLRQYAEVLRRVADRIGRGETR